MGKQLIRQIREDYPTIWDEMAEVADIRDRVNKEAFYEMRELLKLKESGNIKDLTVKDVRNIIESKKIRETVIQAAKAQSNNG